VRQVQLDRSAVGEEQAVLLARRRCEVRFVFCAVSQQVERGLGGEHVEGLGEHSGAAQMCPRQFVEPDPVVARPRPRAMKARRRQAAQDIAPEPMRALGGAAAVLASAVDLHAVDRSRESRDSP